MASSAHDMSPTLDLDAVTIAQLSLHDPNHFSIQQAQTRHRLELIKHWNISSGSRVLELGCGQGDCTTVLASVVGEHGAVVAVDPADLSYGAPYTLGQAQEHISQGPLGSRITWIQHAPLEYLSSLPPPTSEDEKPFDAVVLAHSIWYFASPSIVLDTFRALRQYSKRLLLAEWSLTATRSLAQPHVLAVLAQAALDCRKEESESNVRTVLASERMAELAVRAGWNLQTEGRVDPGDGLLDGQWEVDACLSSDFEGDVEKHVRDDREKGVVLAIRDACEASLEVHSMGRKGVRAMDVWIASFVCFKELD